ncbi:MAG: hypothetical protein IIA83_00140 [Thaumarchaeota archaeon]|nr:hypothetical protein [Nitrososphaerota archaeon]
MTKNTQREILINRCIEYTELEKLLGKSLSIVKKYHTEYQLLLLDEEK